MPRSTKQVGLNQLRVGIFVLVSIVILIFLILNASGDINPFKKRLHLKARFADANGLREGSEVRLSGVRVGQIDKITLLPPSTEPTAQRVEALMTIDAVIDGRPATERIRQDSTAQQGSPSLLGNEMLINISPGTALAPQVKDYDILRSSSSNTVNDFATSGTDVAQRLSKLSDQLSGIVKDVQEGKGTVGRLFSDEALYNNLNATVRETEEVMRLIKSGNGSAGRLVNDPALYNNANELATQLRTLAEDLRAGKGTAGKLLTNDELYNRVNRTADRLDHSVDQINSMIADINAGHGTLGHAVGPVSLVQVRLHRHEVHDPAEILFFTERQLNRRHDAAAGFANGGKSAVEARALTIEPVEEDQPREPERFGLCPHLLGLHFGTRDRVNDDDRGIGDVQRGACVAEEIRHAGRVDQIDFDLVPLAPGGGGG